MVMKRLIYTESLTQTLVSNADDTTPNIHADSDCQVLQHDLDNLAVWEKEWKMEFHADKCKVLRIGRKRNMVHRDYVLQRKALAPAESANYTLFIL